MTDLRLEQAKIWLTSLSEIGGFEIKPLAGDASFRRYFRVFDTDHSNLTYVLMDAPPTKEDVLPFLQVCAWLDTSGLNTPKVLIKDLKQGFLLLQDFGDSTWSEYLRQQLDSSPLFEDGLRQLHTLQSATATIDLPQFDINRMQVEINLYLDWYLPYLKQYQPNQQERDSFHQALLPILEQIHHIPKAPVHLDYHSRNLMVPTQGLPLGVIDFQDAVIGPITYDLASLLYDCYQDYPEEKRLYWSEQFYNRLNPQYQCYFNNQFSHWHHSLRLTALQRHIKAIGIFSRLAYRDGKKQFLEEIPLTRKHLDDELQALSLHIPLLNQ